MEDIGILAEEKTRETAYRLLAQCYGQPDEWLDEAVAGLASIFQDGDQEVSKSLAEMRSLIANTDLQDLQVEHARLFIGPFELQAPPYGSVYLENARQVMGNSTVAVVKEYEEAGLRLRDDFRDAPDHIAVELEYAHYLSDLIVRALDEGSFEVAREIADRRAAFLGRHLGAWVDRFAQKMLESSTSGFYRNLARITRAIVAADLPSGERYAADSGAQ